MMSFHRRLILLAWMVLLLVPGTAQARDLGADLKKAMKEKAAGTYYLKTNVPYLHGRHAYGSFKRPVVSVTPKDGVKIESSAEMQGGAFHAEGRRLVLRVNDPVKVDEYDWDGEESTLEIELMGTGRAEGDGVLKFTDLKSVADLETCWGEAFSDVSIETKYDWPEEIRKAVVERKVQPGMTPEQVLVAVGDPERVSHTTDQGKKVEVWTIQRGEGAKMGFWSVKLGDKQEMEIRFVDGKVTQIGGAEEQTKVKLK